MVYRGNGAAGPKVPGCRMPAKPYAAMFARKGLDSDSFVGAHSLYAKCVVSETLLRVITSEHGGLF